LKKRRYYEFDNLQRNKNYNTMKLQLTTEDLIQRALEPEKAIRKKMIWRMLYFLSRKWKKQTVNINP